MELALSLGDPSKPFSFLDKTPKLSSKDLGFCMGLGNGFGSQEKGDAFEGESRGASKDGDDKRVSSDLPLQLDLLPFSPVPRTQPSSQLRLPWLTDNREYFICPFLQASCFLSCSSFLFLKLKKEI